MRDLHEYLLYFICWERFGTSDPICPSDALEGFELMFGEILAKEINVHKLLDESDLFTTRSGISYCCEAKTLSSDEKVFLRFVRAMIAVSPVCFKKKQVIMELVTLDSKISKEGVLCDALKSEEYACKCSSKVLISSLRNFMELVLS